MSCGCRFGKWTQVAGEDLLPGDVISIARPSGMLHTRHPCTHVCHAAPAGPTGEDMVVPADAVLLAGTCICDEAILTGESTPQWKAPLPEEAGESQHLSIKRDKRHGTVVELLMGCAMHPAMHALFSRTIVTIDRD